jgi:hypothetical protein
VCGETIGSFGDHDQPLAVMPMQIGDRPLIAMPMQTGDQPLTVMPMQTGDRLSPSCRCRPAIASHRHADADRRSASHRHADADRHPSLAMLFPEKAWAAVFARHDEAGVSYPAPDFVASCRGLLGPAGH